MPWPLFVIGALIGAGAGYMATGTAKGALMGGALGAVTGGMGGALMGGAGAAGAAGAGAAGAAGAAGGVGAASGAGALAGTTALTAPGLAVGTGGIGAAGLGGQGAGMFAALQGGVPAGTAAGLSMGVPAYTAPALANAPWISSSALGGQGAGLNVPAKEQAARKIDTSALGESVQGSLEEEPEASIDPRLLPSFESIGGGGDSVEDELALAAANMRKRTPRTPPGLRNIQPIGAARGGIMQVPSGSLTGGQLVGPGTGTSDSIRSSIFPDIASKLGASSSLPGKGHSVQRAALSDGEYVLTAKAVEGFGKKAGAPPGQEREYGSKLLDNVMNQMQRV